MAPSSDPPSPLELHIPSTHPELLAGLETLVQLGLLTDHQVRQLAEQQLCCAVPDAIAPSSEPAPPSDFADAVPARDRPRRSRSRPAPRDTPTPRPRAQLVPQVLNSLMNEISVVWLLFLGVFLVVVSSAVLAATQWQNFSPLGQYGILLGYTVAFWVASVATARNPQLQTTSGMLQTTTLLIIPINFWMMDGFRLWQVPGGVALAAIAGLVLSGLAFQLWRTESRWLLVNLWGLSWLHWGWQVSGWPLWATYLGTVGTTGLLLRWQGVTQPTWRPVPRSLLAIAFGSLLLVGRALLATDLPLATLGLAWGVLGWLLLWLPRRQPVPGLALAGVGLLVSAWGVTAVAEPAAAIAVSGLALLLLGERLQRGWPVGALLGLIAVGGQAWWLGWLALPQGFRGAIATQVSQWLAAPVLDYQLMGLWSVPFLWVLLALAAWLRHRQQFALVRLTEAWTLVAGVLFLLLVTENPSLRALYLFFSTLTLGVVAWRHPQPARWLAYLTNGVMLGTVASAFEATQPNAGVWQWGLLVLGLVVAEWAGLLMARSPAWRQSCWYWGLGLAALSYPLLVQAVWSSFGSGQLWRGLPWLVVPLGLTGWQRWPRTPQPQLAGWLGVASCLLVPGISAVHLDWAILGASVSTVLLLALTARLRHWLATVATVGMGLNLAYLLHWKFGNLDFFLWQGLVLWGLWGLRWGLTRRQPPALAAKYATALNGWAIAIAGGNLGLLTLGSLLSLTGPNPSGTAAQDVLTAAAVTTGAIALRLSQQPTNLGYLGAAWGLELTLWSLVVQQQWPLDTLILLNAALGLLTQVAADCSWGRAWQPPTPLSWRVIPLGFAGLALWQAHGTFTATTGLYTLAAALVAIGVGRRHPAWQPFTYLGIVGLTVGASEWVIFQLLQGEGGTWGDGATLLALVPTAIALGYLTGQRRLAQWWQLPPPVVQTLAHGHWIYASLLILLAALPIDAVSHPLLPLWLGLQAVLLGYAAWQGRRSPDWVYVAVAQLTLWLGFGLTQRLPGAWLGAWGGAIAALVAALLYHAPWERWGWPARPWHQAGLIFLGLVILLTAGVIGIPSLLLAGGVYGWVAFQEDRLRLSYVSVGLANWAGWLFFAEWHLRDPLWGMALVSASLLYGAQVDPGLRSPPRREPRHWVRMLALGLFGLTALYQSDGSLEQGFLVILLGMALVVVGLVLRVRAVLYVGTLIFVLKVLRQLWLFISEQSLLLWALGISLGLVLIGVAVTFEARRSQAIAWVQYWVTELESWD